MDMTEQIIPHIIIPMAGNGQRFRDAGYTDDKPLIPVGGRRMLEWVIDSIPEAWRSHAIGIARDEQSHLQHELWCWVRPHTHIGICTIPGLTQGAACTVLAAAVGLPPDEPVLVMNADQYIVADLEQMQRTALLLRYDGVILTFPGTGPAWSYAVTDGTDRVVQVVEKRQVSPHATCGLYWWRRAGDLVQSICDMIAAGDRTNGEFYLAPAFNQMIQRGKDIRIAPVKAFHGLGTPEQVTAFEAYLSQQQREATVVHE